MMKCAIGLLVFITAAIVLRYFNLEEFNVGLFTGLITSTVIDLIDSPLINRKPRK